jgi:alpha-glucosidase (family GH31 glycosyl hydrolase)
MQIHRQVAQNDLRQYPWGYPVAAEDFDKNSALENYRFYARLHTRLFPYIYTHAKESSTNGLPIIRPLVLLHQDDPKTYSLKHTYYFGNEMLVAPVVNPTKDGEETERTLYLPEGNWYDYWTQERRTGKKEIRWKNRNQQQFPLFIREGAIIPMLLAEAETLCEANYVNNPGVQTPDEGLWFLIYPGDVCRFAVHDGTDIRCENSEAERTVTLTSTARPVVLKILTDEPATVTRDGESLKRFSTPPNFDASNSSWAMPPELAAAGSGWLFAATAGFLFIKFQHPGGETQIRF